MQLDLVLPAGRNNVQQSVSLILCINPDIAVVGVTASVDVQRVGLVDDRLDAYGGGELGEQPLLFLGSAVGPQSHILAIAQRSQVAPLNVETLASTNVGNTVRLCPMGIQRVVTGLRDRSAGSVLLGLLLGVIPPTDKRVAGSGGSGEGAVRGAGGDILTALATGTAVGVERNLDGGTATTAALRGLQNILALAQDARLGSVLPVAVEVAESDLTSDRPPAFSHFNLGTVVGPDHGRVATGGAHDISRFQGQTGKAGLMQHPAREFIFIFPGVDLSGGDFHSGQQKPQEQGKAVALYRVGELIRRTLTSARTVRHSPIRSGQLIWANASIPVLAVVLGLVSSNDVGNLGISHNIPRFLTCTKAPGGAKCL